MTPKALFSRYLKNLADVARQGDAREESFYPALADMLKEVADATGRTHVHVTALPRPTEGGNPDCRLWNGADRIIGYVEAKKPTEDRLDIVEDSEQLQRYRATFSNLLLTNFLEFRLYRNGERVQPVRIRLRSHFAGRRVPRLETCLCGAGRQARLYVIQVGPEAVLDVPRRGTTICVRLPLSSVTSHVPAG